MESVTFLNKLPRWFHRQAHFAKFCLAGSLYQVKFISPLLESCFTAECESPGNLNIDLLAPPQTLWIRISTMSPRNPQKKKRKKKHLPWCLCCSQSSVSLWESLPVLQTLWGDSNSGASGCFLCHFKPISQSVPQCSKVLVTKSSHYGMNSEGSHSYSHLPAAFAAWISALATQTSQNCSLIEANACGMAAIWWGCLRSSFLSRNSMFPRTDNVVYCPSSLYFYTSPAQPSPSVCIEGHAWVGFQLEVSREIVKGLNPLPWGLPGLHKLLRAGCPLRLDF